MKISDSNLNAVTTPTQQPAQAAAAGAGRSGGSHRAADGNSDQVQLSDLSSTLKALTSGSPEREARIAELATAYQGGSYQVNAGAVSRTLINDALGPN